MSKPICADLVSPEFEQHFPDVLKLVSVFPDKLDDAAPDIVKFDEVDPLVYEGVGVIVLRNILDPSFAERMDVETDCYGFLEQNPLSRNSALGSAYFNRSTDTSLARYLKAFDNAVWSVPGDGICRIFTNVMQDGNDDMRPHADTLLSSPTILTANRDNGGLLIDPTDGSTIDIFNELSLTAGLIYIPYGPRDLVFIEGRRLWHKGVRTGEGTRKTFAAQRI